MRAVYGAMTQRSHINRRWLLDERPSGEPTSKTLQLAETSVPVAGDEQLLLRTVYLSLDPYMREIGRAHV